MVIKAAQSGSSAERENARATTLDKSVNSSEQVAIKLADLKEKIDALAQMPEKGKLYRMAANMSARVLEMASSLPEKDPDKEEALSAVSEVVDAVFELRGQDNIIHSSNDEAVSYENDVITA